MSYSIHAYAAMMADRVRIKAYDAALGHHVAQDSVVLDLGAGAGILSLLACAHGARVVYAIESEDIIQTARELAAANGFSDRIQFIQEHSTRVTLPERADLLVCDLRGTLPLHGKSLSAILDARTRLLKPGAPVIPQKDILRMALAQAGDLHAKLTRPWEGLFPHLNLEPLRNQLCHQWGRYHLGEGALLSRPQTWHVLDYTSVQDQNIAGRASCTATRNGLGHGLFLWFDADLAPNIGFSAMGEEAPKVYGRAFFPWPEPLPLKAGDRVEVEIRADLVGEEYLWRWTSSWYSESPTSPPKRRFEQNSFLGTPFSLQSLKKQGMR